MTWLALLKIVLRFEKRVMVFILCLLFANQTFLLFGQVYFFTDGLRFTQSARSSWIMMPVILGNVCCTFKVQKSVAFEFIKNLVLLTNPNCIFIVIIVGWFGRIKSCDGIASLDCGLNIMSFIFEALKSG